MYATTAAWHGSDVSAHENSSSDHCARGRNRGDDDARTVLSRSRYGRKPERTYFGWQVAAHCPTSGNAMGGGGSYQAPVEGRITESLRAVLYRRKCAVVQSAAGTSTDFRRGSW